jgi:hypothetical protein
MARTTSEVIDTLNDALSTVEAETSDLADGVRAVVSAEEIPKTMRTLRRELGDDEWEAKRGPSSDSLVVHIEAEEKERGLGELFK